MEQGFTSITPHAHLMATEPLEEVEHIQAVLADEASRKLLEMQTDDPVHMLRRRTWSARNDRHQCTTPASWFPFSLAGRMAMAR